MVGENINGFIQLNYKIVLVLSYSGNREFYLEKFMVILEIGFLYESKFLTSSPGLIHKLGYSNRRIDTARHHRVLVLHTSMWVFIC